MAPAARPRPPLPAEPPPPVADLASEVPKLEAKLAANKTYVGVWDPSRRDELNLLLTAVSSLLASGAFAGPLLAALDARAAKLGKGMEEAAIAIAAIHWRTNTYPSDFTRQLRSYLEKAKLLARRGTWEPYRKGSPPVDFTALAAWLHSEDPAYLREMLAARRDGPSGWPGIDPKKPPDRPWLSEESSALQRLALIDDLTPAEQSRRATLKTEGSIVRVALAELLAEYTSNEARADVRFKGKVVQVSGVVSRVGKDLTGGVFIKIGTGKQFERPELSCALDKNAETAALTLNKGDQISVRGKVGGLFLSNVGAVDCTLVQ